MIAAAITNIMAAQTAGFLFCSTFFTLSFTATSPKASGQTAVIFGCAAQATSARE